MFEQLSNTLTNRQLYKKAYLIEFYGTNEIKPDDVFTFSVPPESEELTYPQKKTETKTFGGLHVDDYGVDAVKVVLSGSTINQSIKRIYKGGFGKDDWLTGEEEVYAFRNLILKYKDLNFLRENKKAKIIIYDLSKFTGLRISTIDNYWQTFIGDFKIRRSNDRPFTYKYTLEFTGVKPKSGLKKLLPMGSEALGALAAVLGVLKNSLDFLNDVQALIDDALGYVDQVSQLMKEIGRLMTYTSGTIPAMMYSVNDSLKGLVDGAASIVEGANSSIATPRAIQLSALSIGLDMQNALNRLVKSTAALCTACRKYFDDESWEVPREVLDQYAQNNEEFKDSANIILNRAENSANEVGAWGKSSKIPDVTEGNTDPVTGDTQAEFSFGHFLIVLKETDSLESLATEYFGDPDRSVYIAAYNKVASLSDLSPGDTIKIPIMTRTNKFDNNLIFSRRENRDNYGRDIMLTGDGFIVASNSGDYQLTEGVQNLSQSILLRLRESIDKRIRLNTYGIRKNIGDSVAGIAYIISSVKLTVSNDPRVAEVDKIDFNGEGDALYVIVYYHDINNASNKVSGRI